VLIYKSFCHIAYDTRKRSDNTPRLIAVAHYNFNGPRMHSYIGLAPYITTILFYQSRARWLLFLSDLFRKFSVLSRASLVTLSVFKSTLHF